ncbi:MAG TPA: hypothetical protein VLE44_03480 [Candidatus Saccharimonadales bacterium]|nr:hypothetical protein [Candidatus Saccharimonadales bacterium]
METSSPSESQLDNVRLTEPILMNGTYSLDLKRENNPNFYALAKQITDSASETNPQPNLETIISEINKKVPKVEKDMGTYKENTQSASEKPTVPIDTFFDPNKPSAYCLERSLLTQLVLTNFGMESKLLNLRAESSNEKFPHMNHILLEVVPPKPSMLNRIFRGKKQEGLVIESTAVEANPVSVHTKDQYIKLHEGKGYKIKSISPLSAPNVFEPKNI